MLTPYLGVNLDGAKGNNVNTDSLYIGLSMPRIFGDHLGTSLDFRVHNQPVKQLAGLGLRLDVGAASSTFKSLRSDLGAFYFYTSFGISFWMWGSDRNFDIGLPTGVSDYNLKAKGISE